VDTPYLADIGAGVYLIGIQDSVNCQSFLSLVVEEPPELLLVLDTTNISCFGERDGSFTPRVTGGTGGYNFTWAPLGITDSLATNLGPGNYTVSVTDANGCTMSQNGLIIEPRELSLDIDSTRDVICFGDQTGAIFLNGVGGNPPYEFSLDGLDYTPDLFFNQLGAGMYSIFVQDSRGCVFDTGSEIFQPDPLIVDAGLDTTIDLGFRAPLLAIHSPPLKPVDFSWSPAGLVSCDSCPSTISGPVTTTTFTITITDDDLCTAVDSVTVFVFLNRPVFVPNSITPNGDGLNDRLGIFAGPAGRAIRKIQIYDRWGEMVFEGSQLPLNDEALGWDGSYRGQPLNPGVFVYVAEIEFIDDSVLQLEGDITLVR
jgi:gliding motility-associated-like protein